MGPQGEGQDNKTQGFSYFAFDLSRTEYQERAPTREQGQTPEEHRPGPEC